MSAGLTCAACWRYAGCMRYAQGGGLTAEGRRRRERVGLEAVAKFEQRVPAAVIAAGLRVSERSARRWRRAWHAAGAAGLASRGQARPEEDPVRARPHRGMPGRNRADPGAILTQEVP